jgi:glycosyltransferase involved in cell wall biosynthesis
MKLQKRLYYHVKPFLPWRLRMAARGVLARRTLKASQDIWPINQSAARKPEGWEGWPDRKQFAVVLSHDVEGPKGLDRCRQLMAIEEACGFRSSYNLIPEGAYRVPKELRDEMVSRGFEVGVHDLKHDGKLYNSRSEFRASAQRINGYLKDWNAVGFRAGFMYHNLEWLHDLDCLYDASTFDTDPFEPQPDGAGTIFPFWVGEPGQKGYVEMPYTLCQDHTMFILLREQTIDIWKRKIDWIAHNGGMVFVDTHPDYINFGSERPNPQGYPCSFYSQLLQYISSKYTGQYWHALPRDVAKFAAQMKPRHTPAVQRRICMVAFSAYQTDNRVIRYSEALGQRGDLVDVVAVSRQVDQLKDERVGNVKVHRVQFRGRKNHRNKVGYLLPLLRFWAASSWWLCRNHLKKRYDVIHVHNVPDFLVFAAWLPKLMGAKIILDIHDIVPEFYASKFHLQPDSVGVRMLKWIERLAAKFSDHVIISNDLWYEKFVARSAPREKTSVFINHVDSHIFYPRKRTRTDGKFIILFPGGLQWHQGLDIAIRAFAKVVQRAPGVEFHIYGDGNVREELIALTHNLGLDHVVKFNDPLPVRQIAEVMANADLGVVPKRADSFGNEAYSTKIMEFMSVGVPVVVSRTKIDSFYFTDDVVRFFESGNEDALAQAMLEAIDKKELRQKLVANANAYVAKNSWDMKRSEYYKLVDTLTPKPAAQS